MTTAASPSGATIPVYDSVGNAWTVVSGVVQVNGAPAGTSFNVATLLFYSGVIYQENAQRNWFSWSGTAWVAVAQDPRLPPPPPPPPPPVESASGTTIPPATSIIDAALNTWTVAAGVVQMGGKPAGTSFNVETLLFYNGVIWQENTSGQWYSWTNGAWVGPSADPRTPVTPPPPPPPPPPGTPGLKVTVINGKGVITDLSGNPVQIQGTSISGLETNFAPTRWPAFARTTVAQWKQIMAAWNINTFRNYIDEWSWRTNPSVELDGVTYTYQGVVQACVENQNTAGAYNINVLMWAAPASVLGGKANGQPGMITTGSGAGDGVTFWASFAKAPFIVNNPMTICEIFNEPYYDNNYNDAVSAAGLSMLLNGGTMTTLAMQNNTNNNAMQSFSGSFQIAGVQAMLNAIRGAGFTGIVLYPQPWWCGEIEWSAKVRPTDPLNNLGAAQHEYGYNPGVAAAQAAFEAVLNAGDPVIVTETYGLANIGGFTFAQANKIGYTYGPGPNNWGSAADLSKLITTPPWDGIAWGADTYNYDAYPPFGAASG